MILKCFIVVFVYPLLLIGLQNIFKRQKLFVDLVNSTGIFGVTDKF